MKSFQHRTRIGQKDEWLTPPHIMRSLGEFDLDPCAPVVRPWPTAAAHFTKDDDGLRRPWAGRVWLNPPYGEKAQLWIERLRLHGNGIALVPARTETRWFFDQVWGQAHAVLFVRGRVRFHHVNGQPADGFLNAPIILVAYGCENADTLRDSNLGFFTRLRRRVRLEQDPLGANL